MTEREPQPEALAEIETWFDDHGLPYFAAGRAEAVATWLNSVRILIFLVLDIAGSVAIGLGVFALGGSPGSSVLMALIAGVLALGAYGGSLLRWNVIARWAIRESSDSIGLLFPLVTRALPLLLLFVTFLFINAEVWQVASGLNGALLWTTVLLFAGIAIAFLLVRLPDEVRRVEQDVSVMRLAEVCAGTPAEQIATELAEVETVRALPRWPRTNLVLVMLFSQAMQVLLLSAMVFAFFLVFGIVAVGEDVITSWIGHQPHVIGPQLWNLPPLTEELIHVALFLAAFSGLYFTVYAVTDVTYRTQFFARIDDDLERAIAVHAAYGALIRRRS